MIEFKDITKSFGKSVAIENLNFVIEKGNIVCLIGLSGCGKTTTLRMINKLIEATKGKIYIDGEDIDDYNKIKLRRKIGYVIQQTGLFPHMTVKENIEIIPKSEGKPLDSIEKSTKSLMEMVRLDYEEYKDKYPQELSGGQQQRVGIARAFSNEAKIILMDEPFSALDPITKGQLQDELISIQEKWKKTIVFVTHDMDEAIKMADKICIMDKGTIVQYDTPERILRNPASKFINTFIGENKLWNSPELLKAIDIMDPNPITITINSSVFKGISKLKEKRVETLVVVDGNNKYMGILKAKDLRMSEKADEKEIKDLMKKTYKAFENDSIMSLFEKISEEESSFIPVLKEDNTLSGIVTKTSLILTFINNTLSLGQEG